LPPKVAVAVVVERAEELPPAERLGAAQQLLAPTAARESAELLQRGRQDEPRQSLERGKVSARFQGKVFQ
jgi:hypothetical protein